MRAGHTDPHAVLSGVIADCKPYASRYGGKPEEILKAIRSHFADALDYAKDRIAYEAIPYEQRQQMKSAKRHQYQQEHMEKLEPTPKQLDYLVSLGYFQIPENRAEASRIIDELVSTGRKL